MNHVATRPHGRFHQAFALYALLVALTGFASTYFLPIARGGFHAPWFVHAHGGLLFGWLVLLVVQTTLARQRRMPTHRLLGRLALPLAAGMAASTLAVAYRALRLGAANDDPTAVSSLLGSWTTMAIFAGLLGAAIHFRKRPEIHKRLIVVATVSILWPAWFRFRHLFPQVPRPEIVFAVVLSDAPIVVAALLDRTRTGRVHPAYLWAGGALIAEHVAEVLLFDTAPWRAVAGALARLAN